MISSFDSDDTENVFVSEAKKKYSKKIIEEIRRSRGFTLDIVELVLGDSPEWKMVRSRLLKIFGERGLEQRVLQIFSDEPAGRDL
ncbi:MAG: hypothetical protein AB7H97_11310 [Pseudobdellovibrionaceae bacterium]